MSFLRCLFVFFVGFAALGFAPQAKAVIQYCPDSMAGYSASVKDVKDLDPVNVPATCLTDDGYGGFGIIMTGGGNVDPGGGGSAHTSVSTAATTEGKLAPNPIDCAHKASVDTGGEPIVFSSGAKVDTITDFALPGEMGLRFVRYYNSRGMCAEGIPCAGVGTWTTNLDYYLIAQCNKDPGGGQTACDPAEFVRPDGSRLYFHVPSTFYDTAGTTVSAGTGTFTNNGDGTYTLHDEDAKILTFDTSGTLLSIKDSLGIGWTLTRPVTGTVVVTHTNGQSFTLVVTNDSSAYGATKQLEVTDPAGHKYDYTSTTLSYDGQTDAISRIGALTSVTLPGTPSTVITYKYFPDDTAAGSYAQLKEVDYNGVAHDVTSYDGAGRANMTSLANGDERFSILYGSNSTGPTATVTNPLGHVNVYQYNGASLLVSISGQAATNCAATFSSNTYDANGFMQSSTDANNNVTQYTYDASGLLHKKVEAVGTTLQRTIDYEWDSAAGNRLSSVTVEGWSKTAYHYDAQNRMDSVAVTNLSAQGVANQTLTTTYVRTLYGNGLVHTLTVTAPSPGGSDADVYTYDAYGRMSAHSNGLGQTTTYSNYNALGEVGKTVGPNGDEVDFVYDERGRIQTKTTHPNGGAAMWSYSYDGFGLIATETDPDGKVTVWTRDPGTMRVMTIDRTEKDGNSTETLGYDANGDVTSDVVARGSDVGLSQSFKYDALGRLYQKIGMHGQLDTYGYDGNNNLALVTNAAGHITNYQYDAFNRVSLIRESGGATLGVPSISLAANNITGAYTVSWSAASAATSYTLQEEDSGTWSNAYSGSAISQAVSGKASGTYGYRVRACNGGGCGEWSDVASITVLLPPAAPSSISVPSTSNGPVAISWTASATATSYALQRSANGGTWGNLYSGSATSYAQTESTTGSYTYRVQACNASGCSTAYTTSSAVAVTIAPSSAPSINVPATSSTGAYTVSWSAVSGATSYTLREQVNGGTWGATYSVSSTSKAFSGKTNGATYGYSVQACNAGGCGPWSGTGTVAVAIPPPAPTNVYGNDEIQNIKSESITVVWDASSGATRYDLEKYSSGPIIYSGTSTSFTAESGAPPLPDETFAVRACNAYACSGWVVAAIRDVTPAPTAAPSLSLAAGSSQGSYTASWTTIYHASSYTLQEQVNSSGVWNNVYAGTATSMAFSGKAIATYAYRVQGCSDGGCGPWSTTATIAVDNPPPAPTNVHETETGTKVISLKVLWDSVSTATSYDVKLDASSTIVYSGTATSYTIATATFPDTPDSHTAYVRSCSAGGCSAWVQSNTL